MVKSLISRRGESKHSRRSSTRGRDALRRASTHTSRSIFEALEGRQLLSTVQASVETQPVPHSGDAADDAAIWVNPTDSAASAIIGTDKQGGIAVYDLAGKQLSYRADGNINNVDLRNDFPLGGQKVALVTATNRSNNSLAVYKVNPSTRALENVAARTIGIAVPEVYGMTMYHSAATGKYYAFIGDKLSGAVEQWELFDNGAGKVDAKKVRSFDVGGQSEGMVADDETGKFYIAEETVGIWKYDAEPTAGTTRTKVDGVGGGHLTADAEGLAIYYAPNGGGYLLASSQGSNSYAVYQRAGTNPFVMSFNIASGTVDGVSDTDGIEVTNLAMGSAFPEGVFIAQDGYNDSGNQNYKLVPWGRIARSVSTPLTINTTYRPASTEPAPAPAPEPAPSPTPEATTALSSLSWSSATIGWGSVHKNQSVDGRTLTLNGATYASGLGTHANSTITYNLGGQYSSFASDVGVDDEVGSNGSVVFQVFADGAKIYDSGTMTGASATKSLNVNVAGVNQLQLVVTDAANGMNYDHADWANARLSSGTSTDPAPTPTPTPTAPAAPSGLSATAASSSQINLAWTDNSTDESGFKIERSTDGTNFAQIATVAAGVKSYSNTGLSASSKYYYRVRAYNSVGDSAYSTVASATTAAATTTSGTTYLSDMTWVSASNGWGPVELNKSNGEKTAGDGRTITLNGTTYAKGLGTHANSTIVYNLAGRYSQFLSDIGIDDEVGSGGSATFQVFADGAKIYDSGTMTGASATKSVNVSVAGVNQLQLVVNGGTSINNDHADWANARLSSGTSTDPAPTPTPTPTAPAAPSGLSATVASSSQINLAWTDNSTDESGFKIERSTDGTNFSQIATVAAGVKSYSSTGLNASSKYYYRVRAYNSVGDSAYSAVASATTAAASTSTTTTALSSLSWSSATIGWGSVHKNQSVEGRTLTLNGTTYASGLGTHANSTITYNLGGQYSSFASDVGVDDEVGSNGSVVFQVFADGAKIYDSGTMTGSSATKSLNVNVAGVNQLQLVVTDAANGMNYDHADWANARLSSGTSTDPAPTPTPTPTAPAAPSGLSATAASSSQINLAWTDNSTDESGFKIERSTDGTNFAQIATVAAGVKSYSSTGLNASSKYYYRVRAYSSAGDSAYSAVASATTAASSSSTVTYSGPITITTGGTYTGNWESQDPNVAAVTIKTTSPVTIVNSNVRSRGPLIRTAVSHAKVTIRNTKGYGLNPNIYGKIPGRFFTADDFDSVVLENNYLEGTSGIRVARYAGPRTGDTIKVIGNKAKNIDGRKSNGAGGWLDFNNRTRLSDGYQDRGFDWSQFIQISDSHGVPGIEVAWNQVVNEPGNSHVEDNISIYLSSGTSSSPILIHDNLIDGAYNIKPWQASYSDSTYKYDWSYGGGGIMLGDGKATSLSTSVGYIKCYNNTILSTTNYGIAISAGHDVEAYNNRIISSGLLPDGRKIMAQNVGFYIWDVWGNGSTMYNNGGHDNYIGWVKDASTGSRNDWWIPNANYWTNNTRVSGTITLATEQAERTAWLSRVSSSGRTVGTLS